MKERFAVLDIFRGIFSSFVVFFHMSAFSSTPIINNQFIYNTDLFVDFFFVLSGFVIAYNYQFIKAGSDLAQFYKKRFFRLYPLHLFILLIFVMIEFSKHSLSGYVHVNKLDNTSNNPETFLTNIFLVNSIKLPGVHDVSWNIASWSVSAEMVAYFIFGLIILLINRNNLSKIKSGIYFLVVIAALSTLYLFTGDLKLNYSYDFGFLRGITGFFTGVCCFTAYNASKLYFLKINNLLLSGLEIFSLVLIFVFVSYGSIFKSYGFAYEILFFIAIFIFAFERGWLSDLLKKSAFLHQTGKYSYSIYMIHTLILSLFNIIFFRLLNLPPSSYGYLFILNYAIVYFLSGFTYKYIELPFNISAGAGEGGKKGWWVW
jgi:peptidoglycan/LPS O-acetylase OafA/YrhL